MELGVFMFKYSINDLPRAFKTFFSKRSDVHNYPTRHGNDFNMTNNKKTFPDRAIRTNGPILWNSLPENMKQSKSLKHFRTQLKQNLIQNYE